jgi:peptidoglycan/LPS O-acetylase OafA/YrhL
LAKILTCKSTLPGVFESNALQAVNGALWTLKIEVAFYLCVPIFVLLGRRFSILSVLVIAYILSITYSIIMQKIAHHHNSVILLELSRQLPAQLCYFLSGAFFYYKLEFFEKNIRYFLCFAIGILVINSYYPLPIFEPFALATIVTFLGLFFYLGNFGKHGDFSYGFYILHFPIIQIALQLGWLRDSAWYFLGLITVLTAISAILMWHIVEKRFLLRNNHYIKATNT